jgi:hypothetical protein
LFLFLSLSIINHFSHIFLALQAGYVLDELYGVECRIFHVASGAQLDKHVPELVEHFKVQGSPVMMGGDRDNLSKGIMGICQGKDMTYLLVVVRILAH